MVHEMKNVMFVRHNFDTYHDVLERFWKEGKIAIHFENIESMAPEKYLPKMRSPIRILGKYCKEGGLVAADFNRIRSGAMLMGEIVPDTQVEYDRSHGQVFKTVQLHGVKPFSTNRYPLLRAIQPRGGTICTWHLAKRIINHLFYDNHLPWRVESLDPSYLEVVCYEYLRSRGDIHALLEPIGRGLKDIDIHGINRDGTTIYAQVTHTRQKNKISEKIERLKEVTSGEDRVFFFGPRDLRLFEGGLEYIDIEDVFDRLTSSDDRVYREMIKRMLMWDE